MLGEKRRRRSFSRISFLFRPNLLYCTVQYSTVRIDDTYGILTYIHTSSIHPYGVLYSVQYTFHLLDVFPFVPSIPTHVPFPPTHLVHAFPHRSRACSIAGLPVGRASSHGGGRMQLFKLGRRNRVKGRNLVLGKSTHRFRVCTSYILYLYRTVRTPRMFIHGPDATVPSTALSVHPVLSGRAPAAQARESMGGLCALGTGERSWGHAGSSPVQYSTPVRVRDRAPTSSCPVRYRRDRPSRWIRRTGHLDYRPDCRPDSASVLP